MTVVQLYCEGVEALPSDAIGEIELTNPRARLLEVGVQTVFGYVCLSIRAANNRDRSIYFDPHDARTLGLALLEAADDEIASARRIGP